MSLEAKIDALTAAITENNDLLRGLTAKASGGAASAKAEAPAKEDKADKAEKPATRAAKPKAEKTPSVADMKKVAEDYLDVTDEDEYNERRGLIRAIVDHFGAEKFTAIEKDDRLVAKKLVEAAAAGENVDVEDIAGAIESLDGGEDATEKPAARRRNDDV